MKHQLITGAAIAAILSGTVALTTPAESNAAGKEKCYGVVKAGHNDCGNAAGTHSCAGHAEVDGGAGEWVTVPEGLCEKLVGGSTSPIVAEAKDMMDKAEDAAEDMMDK